MEERTVRWLASLSLSLWGVLLCVFVGALVVTMLLLCLPKSWGVRQKAFGTDGEHRKGGGGSSGD